MNPEGKKTHCVPGTAHGHESISLQQHLDQISQRLNGNSFEATHSLPYTIGGINQSDFSAMLTHEQVSFY